MCFGEGEGVGVHCCSSWFVGGGIRGTHFYWVCVSGVVRKADTDQVDPYVEIKHMDQLDSYKPYKST